MNKPFEIYLGSAVGANPTAGTTILLPATPYTILDALERARITEENKPCVLEVMDCKLEYLPQFIAPSANIYELNHLAQCLGTMSDWDLDCFEVITMMDAITKEYVPIPLERLINMTHSTADCQIAYEAYDDKTLGKFYVDNDFPVIPENLPEILYEMPDYEAIGRKTRLGEDAETSVAVCSPKKAMWFIAAICLKPIVKAVPCRRTPLAQSASHTVMLEVCKGYFNDSEYHSGASEYPMLPAVDGILDRAIAQVGAASIEECSIRAVDCIVPKLSEIISDALYATNCDCYGAVNELATQLQRLEQSRKLYTYKTMMAAAPQDITLDEALDLSQQVKCFSVIKEVTNPADYARDVLSKYCIEQADELFANTNLRRYGEKLIAEKGV